MLWCEFQWVWAATALLLTAHIACLLVWLHLPMAILGKLSIFLASPTFCSLHCILGFTLTAHHPLRSCLRDPNFATHCLPSQAFLWNLGGNLHVSITPVFSMHEKLGWRQDLLPGWAVAWLPWTWLLQWLLSIWVAEPCGPGHVWLPGTLFKSKMFQMSVDIFTLWSGNNGWSLDNSWDALKASFLSYLLLFMYL
jgi:hypothetical protein